MPVPVELRVSAQVRQALAAHQELRDSYRAVRASAAETSSSATAGARENVAQLVRQREALRANVVAYQELARTSARGSEQQVAANRLAADSARQLGVAYRHAGEQALAAGRNARRGMEESAAMRGFTSRASGVGGWMAGPGFIAGAVGGIAAVASVRELAREQESQALLRNALEKTRISWRANRGEVERYIAATERASGFDRVELRQSLGLIIRATGNLRDAQRLETAATNLSRGAHIDQHRAVLALIRAYEGNMGSLSRYGVHIGKVTKFQDALRDAHVKTTSVYRAHVKDLDRMASGQQALLAVQQKFGGASAAYMRTVGGRAAGLRNELRLLEIELGQKLAPALSHLIAWLTELVERFRRSRDAQRELREIARTLATIFHALWVITEDLAKALGAVIGAVGGWSSAFRLVLGGLLAAKLLSVYRAVASTRAMLLLTGRAAITAEGQIVAAAEAEAVATTATIGRLEAMRLMLARFIPAAGLIMAGALILDWKGVTNSVLNAVDAMARFVGGSNSASAGALTETGKQAWQDYLKIRKTGQRPTAGGAIPGQMNRADVANAAIYEADELARAGLSDAQIRARLREYGFPADIIDQAIVQGAAAGRYYRRHPGQDPRRAKKTARDTSLPAAPAVPSVADVVSGAPSVPGAKGKGRAKGGVSGGDVASYAVQVSRDPNAQVVGFHLPGERQPYDCSAFTQAVFRRMGITIGSTTYTQQNNGTPVARNQIEPGDLLFFTYPGERRPGHVGIYVGGGMMVHDHGASRGVQEQPVDWGHFNFARRVARAGSATLVGGTPTAPAVPSGRRPAPRASVRAERQQLGFLGSHAETAKVSAEARARLLGMIANVRRLWRAATRDGIITNDELAQITKATNAAIRYYSDAVRREADRVRRELAARQAVFRTEWERYASRALEVFDRETQARLAKIRATVKQFGFAIGQGEETPTERLLRQRSEAQAAQGRREAIAQAQKDYADALAGGDPAAIAEKKKALDQALYDEQTAQLEARAALERQAADAALTEAQRNYEDQRALQREALDAQLRDLEKALLARKITWAKAMLELSDLLSHGGDEAGSAFFAALLAQLQKAHKALTRVAKGSAPDDGAGGPGSPVVPTVPVGSGHGGPRAAAGGMVMSPTDLYGTHAGEVGPEAILPLTDPRAMAWLAALVRGVGGRAGGASVSVTIPNAVLLGRDRDVARKIAEAAAPEIERIIGYSAKT